MNPAYLRLRDALPARDARSNGAFPVDPRRIRAWVDALPRANQQSTLRQIGEALAALRVMRLDGGQRLLAMEALRPTVLEGLAVLDRLLAGSTFPLPPAKAQVAEQIQSFQRELALAYRIAAVELCEPSGSVPFMKGAQVAQVLVRAIYHASRELAGSYFLYRAPPAGQWLAINALYRFALVLQLDDKHCDEPAERTSLSPRQVYAQALLLAVSNPYRFSQREQLDLWPVTRDLAAHVALRERAAGDAAFAVAMEADRGPGYLPEERESGSGDLLWMDLAPLRQALERPLEGNAGATAQIRFRGGPSVVAPIDLLRRLRAGWVSSAERGHTRLAADHELDTVIGLGALHYQLAGHQDFDSFMRDVRGVGVHGNDRDKAAWLQGAESGRAAPTRARVLDQSLGGYRLAWGKEDGIRARVGELIGLAPKAEDDVRRWMIGVIRWMRYSPDGGVDAGVELLARRALAVGLRSIDLLGVPRPPLRGVQIESLRPPGANGLLHLIAPAVLDAGAGRLEVARAADPDVFEEVSPSVRECVDIHVLEQAGDYQLLAAHPTRNP